jgi:hypothetical protein
MAIKRIFRKADGNTVEPATKPKPQVVKHTRKWYGLPSKTPVPAMSYEQIVADRARQEAEQQAAQSDLQNRLEIDRAQRETRIAPPEPLTPTTSRGIFDRKF